MSTHTVILSEEQQQFIMDALAGNNILVDACIGSGKTTAIQYLCDEFSSKKNILYLTYNKLLKLDARSKIQNNNVTVTNYHGFAYMMLKKAGRSANVSDMVQVYLREVHSSPKYDVLIIDEYQDIDQELANLLKVIKAKNPDIQIIAVGDMEQKIYDKTTLNVKGFISDFLGVHKNLEFTKCFRISEGLAEKLGRIWNKKIEGVNPNCKVEEMTEGEVVDFLSQQKTEDILCLGSRTGGINRCLNRLESHYPQKFNKNTVYASITEIDGQIVVEPTPKTAIFTTYDSSKGLERKICVVFDFTEEYWRQRVEKPLVSYIILRNIFCVAASRGKERIIFVKDGGIRLSEKTLSTAVETNNDLQNVEISKMFDFKYKEDVEKCFSKLKITKIDSHDDSVIEINNKDGLIDLSPCIGIYQEAAYFKNYSIDKEILLKLFLSNGSEKYTIEDQRKSLDEKILMLTALETNQKRYLDQVEVPFVTNEQRISIIRRLDTRLERKSKTQVECQLHFAYSEGGEEAFAAVGYADAVRNGVVYELKYVSELKHEHFLQCACYVIALNLGVGLLWNVRDNTMYWIEVPDTKDFLDCVTKAVTRGIIEEYYIPKIIKKQSLLRMTKSIKEEDKTLAEEKRVVADFTGAARFAVIDTETTYGDTVMSIGVVIATSETFQVVDKKYFIITPDCNMFAMYTSSLYLPETKDYILETRENAIKQITALLEENGIHEILAYNASFDKNHLPELNEYCWCDIMKIAAYKQYNSKIPDYIELLGSGRIKSGYGVEPMYRILSDGKPYFEKHNALLDALDELCILQMLNHPFAIYKNAIVGDKKNVRRKYVPKTDIVEAKQEESLAEKLERIWDKYYVLEENSEETPEIQKVVDSEGKIVVNYRLTSMDDHNTKKQEDNINKPEQKYYTVAELSQMLGISKNKIYAPIRSNELPAKKIGNNYHILFDDVKCYEERKRKAMKTVAIIYSIAIIAFMAFFLFELKISGIIP